MTVIYLEERFLKIIMGSQISFTAVGDIFMNRLLPEAGYEGLSELSELISSSEVRFANLETTIHDREGYPFPFSGGTWAMAHPSVLDDLKKYNFNLYNAANNHSMDYSHNGLLATIRHMKKRNVRFAGVGRNLADAAAPVYLECREARVALIAATSSFHETWAAGQQRGDMIGRPGVNPLRHEEKYHVTKSQLTSLREIARETLIDAQQELDIREGFAVETPGSFKFAGRSFVESEDTYKETQPDKRDMQRIIASIEEAKSQADYVLVSIHSHELGGLRKDFPADFLRTFARECIDAGATAVLGHGPHVLRGIECYNGGVIFYSLGNFIFENDTTTHQPADFYEKYGLAHDAQVGAGMDKRSQGGKVGLGVNKDVWNSVVARWNAEDGKIKELCLYPITLDQSLPRYRRGLPRLTRDTDVLISLQKLCEEMGTDMKIRDGIGYIDVKEK